LILAKYIGGASGDDDILGSALEDAFINANSEDFDSTKIVERGGKTYKNHMFDSDKSDGYITMPTLQNYKGTEVYELNGKFYNKNGSVFDERE